MKLWSWEMVDLTTWEKVFLGYFAYTFLYVGFLIYLKIYTSSFSFDNWQIELIPT